MFDAKKVKDECINWIREWFDNNGSGCCAVVGISGGKDSLTLLYALAGLRNFYPKRFDIVGIAIDLGFGTFETKTVEARDGRNPKTGEAIKIDAHKKVHFTTAQTLKEHINN